MKRTSVRLMLAGVIVVVSTSCAPNRGAGYDKALAEARRAVHAGRFDVAADRYDDAARAARIPRDGIYARYEAALARAKAGDVARASRELHEIADTNPPSAYSAQAAFKAADLAWRTDPVTGAAELEAVAVRFPDDAVARVALLRIIRADDDAGAERAIARLDGLLPRVRGKALEEDVVYERGKRIAQVGKIDEAHDAFLAIAERWPYPSGAYFDDALYRASEIDEQRGRFQEAIAHLEHLLSFRETSVTIGSYQRPRYTPALLRIAQLYEERLNDRAKAREALHRLYRDFKTSTERDDALWREAELWQKDGDADTACSRLSTLTSDFPDSRYVPCAIERCPSIKRPSKSKAPATCRRYLQRGAEDTKGADAPTAP